MAREGGRTQGLQRRKEEDLSGMGSGGASEEGLPGDLLHAHLGASLALWS